MKKQVIIIFICMVASAQGLMKYKTDLKKKGLILELLAFGKVVSIFFFTWK